MITINNDIINNINNENDNNNIKNDNNIITQIFFKLFTNNIKKIF